MKVIVWIVLHSSPISKAAVLVYDMCTFKKNGGCLFYDYSLWTKPTEFSVQHFWSGSLL